MTRIMIRVELLTTNSKKLKALMDHSGLSATATINKLISEADTCPGDTNELLKR